MIQQVNLYQSVFHKVKKRFSAVQLVQSVAAAIIVLGIISAVSFWHKQGLLAELEHIKQQKQASLQHLQQIQAQMSARQPDVKLLKRIERIKQDIGNKRQVLTVLSGRSFGNTEGFVAQFTALARQRIEGMWFTNVTIHNGGTSLGLQGHALKPEYVPQYLQRLSGETAFTGTEFKTFLLARSEEKPQWISFNLQSIVEKPPQ